ncbi:hypothetical protein [Glycomyces artemisiae]|uniref:Uncharacterized protein n=1 Tax=Glycomyces artemisiae TaxID=1076443 RepID=A0A2T0UH38_9ACTN|nr:hypothetical protein [Glycomyces artemisiae]PRY57176.1 hypothetical protein B0I28_10722 [Glycomyces artemisiae]
MLGYTTVGVVTVLASFATLLLLAHMALRGSRPSERPAILTALADLWRRSPNKKDEIETEE